MEISSSGSESEPVHEPVPHVPAVEDGEEVKGEVDMQSYRRVDVLTLLLSAL